LFFDTSTAGNATYTTNSGGVTNFSDTAGNATIITNSGGDTAFNEESTGGQARFITNEGGTVDLSDLFFAGGMTAGSIEGAGTYKLGSKALTVGGNELSTEVSGTIVDGGESGGTGGSLIKVGTGTLREPIQENQATGTKSGIRSINKSFIKKRARTLAGLFPFIRSRRERSVTPRSGRRSRRASEVGCEEG
jgi:hypothetical protein